MLTISELGHPTLTSRVKTFRGRTSAYRDLPYLDVHHIPLMKEKRVDSLKLRILIFFFLFFYFLSLYRNSLPGRLGQLLPAPNRFSYSILRTVSESSDSSCRISCYEIHRVKDGLEEFGDTSSQDVSSCRRCDISE